MFSFSGKGHGLVLESDVDRIRPSLVGETLLKWSVVT